MQIGKMYVSGNHSNLFGLQYFNKKDLQSMGLNVLVLDHWYFQCQYQRVYLAGAPMRSKLFYEIRKLKELPTIA